MAHDLQSSELERLRKLLKNSSAAYAEFLANMSHEIRTPLNTIVGMSDLLIEANAHGLEKRQLDVIRKSSQALLRLVDNILDLSRLEAGRMSLEPVSFDVHELITDCFELISGQAHKKGLETILQIAPEVPLRVFADRARLRQILLNLLENAVKYTEKGHIFLKVHWSSTADLGFALSDTGIGMDRKQMEGLFEALSRQNLPIYYSSNGPGLGLTLAKKLIEAMGGQIQVKSELNKGSFFEFFIHAQPYDQSPVVDRFRQDLRELTNLKAVVLDRNIESRTVLKSYLHELGMNVLEITDSAEFANHVRDFSESGFELGFIDYETAGPQVSTWFFTPNYFPTSMRMVVMQKNNSLAWPRLRKKSPLGVQHLLKPVSRRSIAEALKNLYPEIFPTLHRDPGPELLALNKIDGQFRILVVDDSKDNRYLMNVFLRDRFSEICFAENGRSAWELAQQNRFDLIFMDLQMPEMDGVTATQLIRSYERQKGWQPTPIYALTAHVMAEEKARAFHAGCDDYIVKPVTKAVVLDAIARARQANPSN